MYEIKELIENLALYVQELDNLLSKEKDNENKARIEAEKRIIEEYITELKKLPPRFKLTAEHIQKGLCLIPHPEGGFFREFFRDDDCTIIFYLLPEGSHSAWHCLRNTKEAFKLLFGVALSLFQIDQSGKWLGEKKLDGKHDVTSESEAGKFGHWFGARPSGEGFTFGAFRCTPAYEDRNFKLATKKEMEDFFAKNPEHSKTIDKLAPQAVKELKEARAQEGIPITQGFSPRPR